MDDEPQQYSHGQTPSNEASPHDEKMTSLIKEWGKNIWEKHRKKAIIALTGAALAGSAALSAFLTVRGIDVHNNAFVSNPFVGNRFEEGHPFRVQTSAGTGEEKIGIFGLAGSAAAGAVAGLAVGLKEFLKRQVSKQRKEKIEHG